MHHFQQPREGKSVILVNSIMQPDQITFQAQPAKKRQGLPEYNEHSSALDWKPPFTGPRDLYKTV